MKPFNNIAVIDIGSNTIRLLIGKVEGDRVKRIYVDRKVARLGTEISKNKKLNEKSIEKSLGILRKFKEVSEQFLSEPVIAVGTSALREAVNSQDFIEMVKKELGLNIRIISGNEEAFFTLEGIKSGLDDRINQLFALDIGGGSTEWIYSDNDGILMGSLNLGALKEYEKFFKTDPPLQEEIENLRNYIHSIVGGTFLSIVREKIFVTGGTAVTLAMMALKLDSYIPEKLHLTKVSLEEVNNIIEKLRLTPLNERKKIIGLIKDRVDIILPGLMILESVAKHICANNIIVSDYGFIEGIMKNYKYFCYN